LFLIFYPDLGTILKDIGFIVLILGLALDEFIFRKVNEPIELLKSYINFSKTSKTCTKLSKIIGNISGRLILGLALVTAYMVFIPLNEPRVQLPLVTTLDVIFDLGIESYKSVNKTAAYDYVYKKYKEKWVYDYNWAAAVMFIFMIYIYTKMLMNIITTTLTGTYARGHLNKYIALDCKQALPYHHCIPIIHLISLLYKFLLFLSRQFVFVIFPFHF